MDEDQTTMAIELLKDFANRTWLNDNSKARKIWLYAREIEVTQIRLEFKKMLANGGLEAAQPLLKPAIQYEIPLIYGKTRSVPVFQNVQRKERKKREEVIPTPK